MDVPFDKIGRFRGNLATWRKLAWLFLALSIAAVILWEVFGGPEPEDFGYRFSPMYTFSVTGFFFWLFVLLVLVAIGLVNYLYLGITVNLRCPSCGDSIPSKDAWVCGHCEGENRPLYGGIKDSYYTLLTECKHCHRVPQAYKCSKCGNVTPFAEGIDGAPHAYRKPSGSLSE